MQNAVPQHRTPAQEGPVGVAPHQRWDADRYATTARFVSDLGAPVLELLDPRPGERILDLGCGDGALTIHLVEAGATVVAVDAAEDMVRAARELGLDASVADATALAYQREFDAVFSNAVLHWIPPADDVIAGVARALRPGGRFVAEMGGHACVAAVSVALVAVLGRHGVDGWARRPWLFPTAEHYGARLEAGGFVVDDIRIVPRPTPLPGELGDWLGTFAQPFLVGFDDEERAAVVAEVTELCRPALWAAETGWVADYTRLRFSARLPA